MVGGILLKHSVKHAAGLAAVAASPWTSRAVSETCVLMYHRVAKTGIFDFSLDNWNVAPSRLEDQLSWLASHAQCVRLGDVLRQSGSGRQAVPVVALTFDDGFANFRHEVLPLLERYRVPATLFVATRYVGSKDPYPFDRWGLKNRSRIPSMAWHPITWEEIEECLNSGLVSVGSHSHSHCNAVDVGPEQLAEEASVSRECLEAHLGAEHLSFYAYPYGASKLGQVTPAYIKAVQNAGYRMAVTTDLGMARPNTPPFQIPRVEVHTYDSSRILRAKVLGNLWPQSLCDRLRQAHR
jgi:peptidoglycan/xylan/chitin deacetylase (PgdA/CDA1 family)